MKKICIAVLCVFAILMIVWATSGGYSLNPVSATPTKIEFTQTEIDLGKLKQGKPKQMSFLFKNTGDYPLLIHHVETSCGCTEPKWSRKPIKPGDQSEIELEFDAKKLGRFHKTITLFCNTSKGIHNLKIKGEVKTLPN